ncbi:STAS domain-containing protein [Kineococcus sp. LSe6-4]|uniref:STAS domain-containing protein n=1 Tax=Kineococcus halophytocola TaxID=3234027 RepID=A0ABV4H5N7_9ACTN
MATPVPEPASVPDGPAGEVDLRLAPDAATVVLTGEIDDELRPGLDAVTAEVARELRAAARPVLVDASGVSFMDSAGAAFLAKLVVAVRPARLAVRPSGPVGFLLHVTRLSDVVDVVGGDDGDDGDGDGDGGSGERS